MSNPPESSVENPPLRTDSLADSVLILLALAGVQRLIGFGRAILFCRWMDREQLGQWDMAFSFLMFAAPVSVLALSSAFQRYAEPYRQRGQLRWFIRRTGLLCAFLAALAVLALHVGREWFSRLIFGTPERADLVGLLGLALVTVIASNFFFDLFASLRNVRAVAVLHLVSSLVFAIVGLGLLIFWQPTAESAVIAYGAAGVIASTIAAIWLGNVWRSLSNEGRPPRGEYFGKLLPFAAWVWTASLMANLFVITDRYMIIHFSSLPASEALAQIGEYHSSRVLPLILVTVALMLGSMLTPHLSNDWETGRRDRVVARLNLAIKLFGFLLAGVAVGILFGAPWLFRVGFGGKFSGGLAVLPWTLTYCTWFALFAVAQNYLLCREKAHLTSVALAVGVVVNVVLNLILLPRLQLLGAVMATTTANLVALWLLTSFNRRLGFRMDIGAQLMLAVPLLFSFGPWATAAALGAIAVHACRFHGLLSIDEKKLLTEGLLAYWHRFRRLPLARGSA